MTIVIPNGSCQGCYCRSFQQYQQPANDGTLPMTAEKYQFRIGSFESLPIFEVESQEYLQRHFQTVYYEDQFCAAEQPFMESSNENILA